MVSRTFQNLDAVAIHLGGLGQRTGESGRIVRRGEREGNEQLVRFWGGRSLIARYVGRSCCII